MDWSSKQDWPEPKFGSLSHPLYSPGLHAFAFRNIDHWRNRFLPAPNIVHSTDTAVWRKILSEPPSQRLENTKSWLSWDFRPILCLSGWGNEVLLQSIYESINQSMNQFTAAHKKSDTPPFQELLLQAPIRNRCRRTTSNHLLVSLISSNDVIHGRKSKNRWTQDMQSNTTPIGILLHSPSSGRMYAM